MGNFTNSADPDEMWHIIRVYTVCKGKKDLQTKEYCYVLDTQLNKVGSSSELIYFYKQQNIIRGNYDKQGVLLF